MSGFRFDSELGMFREGQFTGSPESSGDYLEDLLALQHAVRRMLRALDRYWFASDGWQRIDDEEWGFDSLHEVWWSVYEKYRAQVEKMLEEDGRE